MDFVLSGKRRRALQGAGRGSRGSAGLRGASSTQRSRFFPSCSPSIPRAPRSPNPAREKNSLNLSFPSLGPGSGPAGLRLLLRAPIPSIPSHPSIGMNKTCWGKGGNLCQTQPRLPPLPSALSSAAVLRSWIDNFQGTTHPPGFPGAPAVCHWRRDHFSCLSSAFFSSPQIGRLLSCC